MEIDVNKFHKTVEVAERIKEAFAQAQGLSLVRIGDGEARAIGHDLLNLYSSNDHLDWLEYAGINLPDELIRELVLRAIAKADIVGFRPDRTRVEVGRVLTHFKIDVNYMCSAGVNWDLYNQGLLQGILRNKRIMLVSRVAKMATRIMKNQGYNVTGSIGLEGFYDLNRVYYYLKNSIHRFDLVLVSAGIPAVVLCYLIGNRLGKIAIDLGHVINKIIDNNFGPSQHSKTVLEWRYKQRSLLNPYQFLLIEAEDSPKVYLYFYGFKHHIANPQIKQKNHLDFMLPLTLPAEIINKIPDGPMIRD